MMELQDILQDLQYLKNGRFPREALTEAIARQDEITPELLAILHRDKDRIDEIYADQECYMAFQYAMFLLAQFREKRGYPVIVEFVSTPGRLIMEIAGGLITEYLGRILASVSCGDVSLIKTLVENPDANEYVRHAALEALLSLFINDLLSREDLVAYFRSLFREKLERRHSLVWDGLVAASRNIYPEELYDDIRQAYEQQFVDKWYIPFDCIEDALTDGKEATLEFHLRTDPHYHLVTDVVKEMEGWYCFQK